MLRHVLHRALLQISRPTLATTLPSFSASPYAVKSIANSAHVNYMPTLLQTASYSTIFTSFPSDNLWEGVTGPKGAAKKRARGKRRVTRPKIDLNRGQRIGVGQSAMKWPGLNAPLTSKGKVTRISQGEVDPDYQARIQEMRTQKAMTKKSRSLPALQRGWSGNKFGGQSIGPPEPSGESNFEGFDTRVLEVKVVSTMTATYGRTARFSAFVTTGNENGVMGFALAKAKMMKVALRQAKKRAAQNLEMFHLCEGRTLWHPAYIHEWQTKIYIKPMPPGTGLMCHRCLATICRVVGIKDIYAKVEGCTTNYQNLTKGFVKLLRSQESYQQLANREQLNVVKLSKDRDMVPQLLASPEQGFSRQVDADEDLDMDRYYFGGHVPNLKGKRRPYWNHHGQVKARYDRYPYRHMASVRLMNDIYSRLHGSKATQESKPSSDVSSE